MTTIDSVENQLAELASQRRDIAAERERLQQEISELTGKLFLINHREQVIREAMPQAVSGAAGPAEREALGLVNR